MRTFGGVVIISALLGLCGSVTHAADVRPLYLRTDTNTAGVAASTVTPTHFGGEVYKTILVCADTPASITYGGSGTNSTGGVKIYDFPEGRILVLGVTVEDMTVTPTVANGFSASDGGDYAFGTASATGATLASTEVDLCPSTSVDPITNVVDSALAASAQFDGTSTAKAIYANFLIDANDITNNVSLVFDSTVTITWMNLGDY